MHTSGNPLLTTGDAAKLAERVPATVRLATVRGHLVPAAVTESGVRLYTREAVLAWVAAATARRRGVRS